jgi:hypothetical protein
MGIFDEKYRVIAVDSQRLTIQGVVSGESLTIVNADPEISFIQDYPIGKLIRLSDPSAAIPN